MPCLPADKPSFRVDVAEAAQPDSNMSVCGDEETESESSPNPAPEQNPTSNALKRVNSANNLAIPGKCYHSFCLIFHWILYDSN